MFIDFSGAEISDDQKAVLALPEVQELLKTSYTEREENTVKLWQKQLDDQKKKTGEFKDNNIELSKLKEELEQKIADAKTGDDSKEVARLTRELADAIAKAEKLEQDTEKLTGTLTEFEQKEQRRLVVDKVQEGIRRHNAINKNAQVEADAESYLIDKALKVFKPNEDGTVTAFNENNEPIGNMQPADWINTSFRENNSFAFTKATGGGATGNTGSGGAGKSFKDMSEKERVALYRSNPDQYKTLKEAA